jgi:hypothetical protein
MLRHALAIFSGCVEVEFGPTFGLPEKDVDVSDKW